MTGGWAHHGGRLAQAREAFGDTGKSWIDLSTGINPHGWPGADGIVIDWQRLPDEDALKALEAAAADFFGVAPELVVALPGTEIGLRLLGDLLPGPAWHAWPSYRTHAEIFGGSNAISAEALEDVHEGTVILANPNNPDGRIVAAEQLLGLLTRLRASKGWLVVDEAFADFDHRHSLARHVDHEVPLVVLRSFGKFFGLAGVRLGFLIGPARLTSRLRAMLGAWPLSAAALAIGTEAYNDGEWIATTRSELVNDAAALDSVLKTRGLTPIGNCPLFRLVEVDDAHAVFDRLARNAILTRPFDYDPRWLRIGLPPSPVALARLDRALADG